MPKQFYSKQFSLESIRSLNVKTVPSQPIQFSISTQFSSIQPIVEPYQVPPLQDIGRLE